jgi:chromate reductase
MRVLAISGSLRRDSYNRKLLHAAAELAPGGVELELWDGLRDVQPFDEDAEAAPGPAVAELRAAIAGADAILISTPEYNSSIPGQLKNAVDWASRPLGTNALWGKDVAVVGASVSAFGAVWSQAELRKVLRAAGARPLETGVAVGHAHERFDEDGRLDDEALREQLAEVLRELAAAAELEGAQVTTR